jgi:hypothetical protein
MSQSLSQQQNVAVEHVFGIDGSHSPSQNDECGISVDRAGNPPRRHTALHGLNFELGGQEPGGNQASRLQGKIKSSVDNRPSHSLSLDYARFSGLLLENAAGPGIELIAIERLLQAIGTPADCTCPEKSCSRAWAFTSPLPTLR